MQSPFTVAPPEEHTMLQANTEIQRSGESFCASKEQSVRCSNCNLREICLPEGMSADEVQRINGLVSARRRLKKGEALQRAGETFKSLYAVRSGSFAALYRHRRRARPGHRFQDVGRDHRPRWHRRNAMLTSLT